MAKIRDFFSVIEIDTERSYDALQNRRGFVEDHNDYGTCMLSLDEPAQQIALIEFKKGVPRGNHFHKKKTEYFLVLNGRLHCELCLAHDRGEKTNFHIKPGNILKILPGCIHKITASDNIVFALEYSPDKFDESDVFRI